MHDIAATWLVVTALLAFLNHRFVRLSATIGVMAIALTLSLAITALDVIGVWHALRSYEESLLRKLGAKLESELGELIAGLHCCPP